MLYGGYFMYVICAAAVFLTCSQQHVVDVLAVASLSSCSAAAAVKQIYSTKTKYINIVLYITMTIPPRVVMTELILHHPKAFVKTTDCISAFLYLTFLCRLIVHYGHWGFPILFCLCTFLSSTVLKKNPLHRQTTFIKNPSCQWWNNFLECLAFM